MSDHEKRLRYMAEIAIDRAEGGAQLEIKDTVLREALAEAIYRELHNAYQMAASA